MPDNSKRLAGWPVENFAVNLRRWNTGVNGSGSSTRVAIMTPRQKNLFFVEFVIGAGVTELITSVGDYLKDQSIYANLKAADLPKPRFATDNLRTYNRNYRLQKKLEFEPFILHFYDDSTSMVMALVKEIINYNNYSGELGGDRRSSGASAVAITEANKFSYNQTGVSALAGNFGDTIRTEMDARPSLGMRLRTDRMFFDAINIYDLGTEPDSINIYTYLNPHLISVDPDARDQTESNSAEVRMTFEYEDYHFSVGQPKNSVQSIIDAQLGVSGSPAYTPSSGHVKTVTVQTDDTLNTVEGNGTTLPRKVLGDFIADNANNTVTGRNGNPAVTGAVDPTTGLPTSGQNFGNSATAALAYYQNQLSQAQASYDQVSRQGVLSPQVLQYRRQQIGILQQQVAALQQYQNGLNSGNLLPFGLDTNTATINTVNILLAGSGDLLGVTAADREQIQNVVAQQLINAKRIALEAQARAEDLAAQQALSQQSLARSPSENAQLAETAQFHTDQATRLRAQAANLTAPTQFPTYAPGNYGNGRPPVGGVISAVTRGIALQAIQHYLAIGNGGF